MKKLDYNTKRQLIDLSGKCFWYWDDFYSFLETCGVPSSIYKALPRENKYQLMTSLLELLERQKRYDLIENIAREFLTLNPSGNEIDVDRAQQLIDTLRSSLGKSFIETEIEKKERAERISKNKELSESRLAKQKKLEEFKQKFTDLFSETDRQKRGYDIEKLFFDLLDFEEFDNSRPFRNPGEQIDGHFKYEKFDYLVEVKWTQDASKQSDLSIFDGKIKGKAQSTRGLFVSINGFDDNSIRKSSGDSPKILFMDGSDLMVVLEGRISLGDLLRLKIDSLVKHGDVYKKFTG